MSREKRTCSPTRRVAAGWQEGRRVWPATPSQRDTASDIGHAISRLDDGYQSLGAVCSMSKQHSPRNVRELRWVMQNYVSLWAADPLNLEAAIKQVEETTNGFHIDIMDGRYVPELAFGIDVVRRVREVTPAVVDVHLMVCDSDNWAKRAAKAGADLITLHNRSCSDTLASLLSITDHGASPSLAIEIDEELPAPDDPVWSAIDRLLIMGTPLGVRGYKADPRTLDKVRLASTIAQDHEVAIFVDGGIQWPFIPAAARAGANGVIAGSIAYGAPIPRSALSRLNTSTNTR